MTDAWKGELRAVWMEELRSFVLYDESGKMLDSADESVVQELVRRANASEPSPKQREERENAVRIVEKHRREVQASPGADGQAYALRVLDDVLSDLRTHSPEEPEDNPAADALDDIVHILGLPEWDYPGQVVRDVTEAVGMSLEVMRDRLKAKRNPKWVSPEEPVGYCVRLRCDDLPPSYQGTFYEANERDAAEEDADAMMHGPGEGWVAEVVTLYASPTPTTPDTRPETRAEPWKCPLSIQGKGKFWDIYDADGKCVVRWTGFDGSDFDAEKVAHAVFLALTTDKEGSPDG